MSVVLAPSRFTASSGHGFAIERGRITRIDLPAGASLRRKGDGAALSVGDLADHDDVEIVGVATRMPPAVKVYL